MDNRITFTGIMPNLVEACSFIPSKYKSHTTFINKALHAIATPLMISSLFLITIIPEISGSLIIGSFTLHALGHFFEGILN